MRSTLLEKLSLTEERSRQIEELQYQTTKVKLSTQRKIERAERLISNIDTTKAVNELRSHFKTLETRNGDGAHDVVRNVLAVLDKMDRSSKNLSKATARIEELDEWLETAHKAIEDKTTARNEELSENYRLQLEAAERESWRMNAQKCRRQANR
jgi:hypothetical protein